MKLGIIGYGRMGKMIEQIAGQRGHQVVSIIDINSTNEICDKAECYIDFSIADGLEQNHITLCEMKIPVVIGVTGWFNDIEKYTNLYKKHGNTGIYSGNFSVGVNLFWKVVKQAAKTFDTFSSDYDVMLHEFHHKNKIDSPSGTALHTADIVINNSSAKNKIVTGTLQRKREDNELHVTATRGGAIPGTHSLIFDSLFDTIEIKHTARTREGFALGAVIAAENICGLEPGLHNFVDIFNSIF